jgi:diguanylate cyclase (GGDEF)-like protein
LIVRFGALDYRNEGSIRFRYRLAGVDRDWVETQENEARYPQLPPGHLVFSVQAIDPLKQRSSTPVSFTLDVRPPWWLTWPFLFLCGVTLSGLAATLWRLRVRYLLRRQHLLEELVALRTAEIELARAALFEQATRDSLTRLLNRPAIMQAFDLCVGTAAREATPLAVGLIDLDHFKSINDRFGHLGGDEVLREVARRLTQALHAGEKAGRYGGEELVVLIPGAVRSEERMQALRDAMTSQPIDVDGVSVAVTCSIGVAWHRPGDTRTTLLQRADERLYVAKNEGRDRVSCEA